jgi:hypothetical protein
MAEMLNKRAARERWHVVFMAHLFKIWREMVGESEKSAGKCRRTELLFKWVADKINSRCAKWPCQNIQTQLTSS